LNEEFRVQFEEIIKESSHEDLHDKLFRMKNGTKEIEKVNIINTKKTYEIFYNNKKYEKLKQVFSENEFIEKIENIDETLEQFIRTYFYKTNEFEFIENKFNHLSEILKFRIEKNMMSKMFFFTPLYNFDSPLEFSIGDNFHVEKISSNEYNKILHLGVNNCGIRYDEEKLKYVLKFSIDKPEENERIYPEIFSQSFLDALRITKNGSVSFGSFYQIFPDDWQAMGRPGEPEPVHGGPTTKYLESDIKLIKEIFDELETFNNNLTCEEHSIPNDGCKSAKKNFEKGRYLKFAIRRFHYIHKQKETEDQITDLIISLEALLKASNEFEIKDKLARRAAFLLGNSDEEKTMYNNFFKKCYDLRSEIVHGKRRKTKIKNEKDEEMTDDEIKNKLEQLVRQTIRRFLRYQNEFGEQEIILEKIENAIMTGKSNI